jgi:hypothetical protein
MSRVSRRKLAHGAVGALVMGAAPPTFAQVDPDERLKMLIAEHHRFDELVEAAQDAADDANAAERSANGKESPRVAALYHRVEALHRAQGRVANTIVNLPAASLVGVAYKLMLWRREAAIRFPDDFYDAHESFTFSAYHDVLRLTGLRAHAYEHDPETVERMRDYWV